jgi:glycosyltransferase involved in cell wall biosynthesis
MRVLLSAYACEPGKGSEQGVGWHWAIELAHLGHEVDVITRSNNRMVIDKALAGNPIAGLHFHYYDLPSWAKWWKRGPRGVHLYYSLWQRGAYRLARRILERKKFDLVHHLTFGVFRQPSFMGRLGLPFVIGPLGGGDATPPLLRRGIGKKNAFQELLRDVSNHLAFWNPSVAAMLRQATLILCKTPENLAILPAIYREKCRVRLEIGLEPERILHESTGTAGSADFLYAGRLYYVKGLHLALKAFSAIKTDHPAATFALIGGGPGEAWFKKLSATLGIQDSVRWLGRVSHEEIWSHYRRYTAFVFPSLRDSSGNVLLEAMSQALPVICLDTGGPGALVPPSCGIKVPVENRSEEDVVRDLAAAMRLLAGNPEIRAQMSSRALEFAKASSWRQTVSGAYKEIADALHGSVRLP